MLQNGKLLSVWFSIEQQLRKNKQHLDYNSSTTSIAAPQKTNTQRVAA